MSTSKNDDRDAFSAAMTYLLDERGYGSETELALETGYSQSYINKIKSGVMSGSLAAVNKIAKALDTTYNDMLLTGEMLLKKRGPTISQPDKDDAVKMLQTIETLTRMLERRDKRIDFLETKIEDLYQKIEDLLKKNPWFLEGINNKELYEVYLEKGMDRRKLDQPDKIPETGDRRKVVG